VAGEEQAVKVSEFMRPEDRRVKGTVRHRTNYRAARRNIAKIAYRQAKIEICRRRQANYGRWL